MSELKETAMTRLRAIHLDGSDDNKITVEFACRHRMVHIDPAPELNMGCPLDGQKGIYVRMLAERCCICSLNLGDEPLEAAQGGTQ